MFQNKAWLKYCLLIPLIASVNLFWTSSLSTQEVFAQSTTEEERGWGRIEQPTERLSTGRKVALVIGNANYTVGSPLRNPVNDANDMAAAFEELGFEILLGTNLNLQEMDELVTEFYQELQNGSVGVFYYAGHGVQSQGENYFMPVDAQIDIERNLKYAALPMDEVLNYMQEANSDINIVIIDACRDNPYSRRWRSNNRGLAIVENTRGMLIAYATAPGDVADDGDGRNGVFTGALLNHIRRPGLEVNSLMTAVRREVYHNTNKQQLPWTASSLIGNFSFIDQSIINTDLTSPSVAVEISLPAESREIDKESITTNSSLYIENNPQILVENLEKNITLEMIKIPTGSFFMGSPRADTGAKNDEFPQHQVNITEEFYIGKYEVTQEQWELIMGNNPSHRKNPKHPVEQMSWNDVQIFIEKLNQRTGRKYRLPSEAEWEYAARGGTQTKYYYGNSDENIQEYGWCGSGETKKIGQLQANDYGLYDTIGNVWEWTQDDWGSDYNISRSQSAFVNEDTALIVLRGGSWYDASRYCRVANRTWAFPSDSHWNNGFRLAISSQDI